jgi:kynureninase
MSLEQAQAYDKEFPTYKDEFEIPTFKSLGIKNEKFPEDTPSIYICGNSLGLMPKNTRQLIDDELDAWSQRAVEAHFNHPGSNGGGEKTDWVDIDLPLIPLLAPLVGARQNEVAAMGSLTANLNALLISFYKPKGKRTKILFEKRAFPSDYYAFLNLVKLFGYDESHLIQLSVKPGETYLKTQDILDEITKHEEELALVCFPGIQYYTAQLFEIEKITNHSKQVSNGKIIVGWDLAHAVGNVPLKLHDWNVDFAAWCSYKYLNSGPGAMAGIYVHEQYTKDNSKSNFPPRLAGWWGNNPGDRFKMLEQFDPINSALSYRQSNPSVIDVVSIKSSLQVFEKAGGVETLRAKSLKLTQYLQESLTELPYYICNASDNDSFGFKILTPLNPQERGCQLSVLFQPHYDDESKNIMERVNKYLHDHAIICDERRPDVLRLAPLPLYNTFEQVYYIVKRLKEALDEILTN